MYDQEIASLDFVRELRLRQWARQNYVTLESRRASWHPVVLDEMLLRDRELLNEAALANPIVEIEIETDLADEFQLDDSRTDIDYAYEPYLGSKFVPLVPDTHFRIDAGHREIPRPHAWARATQNYYSPASPSFRSID